MTAGAVTCRAMAAAWAARQPTISVPAKKNAISLAAFSALSEPCTELASMPSAKSLRMVPSAALAGVGGAHDLAVPGHRVLALEHLHHHRAAGHELDQRREERPLAVHAVERLGLRARQLQPLLRHDPQARLLEAVVDGTGQVAAGRVGLDDRERALGGHELVFRTCCAGESRPPYSGRGTAAIGGSTRRLSRRAAARRPWSSRHARSAASRPRRGPARPPRASARRAASTASGSPPSNRSRQRSKDARSGACGTVDQHQDGGAVGVRDVER